MAALGEYLIRVSSAALISGIVQSFVKRSNYQPLVKLICGLFMLITVIPPLADIPLADFSVFDLPFGAAYEDTAAQGERYAQTRMTVLIKQQTEAYILDKATALDANLSVEVTLSDDAIPVPIAVTISGSISPYNKQRIQQMLLEDLNISKENQIWTG